MKFNKFMWINFRILTNTVQLSSSIAATGNLLRSLQLICNSVKWGSGGSMEKKVYARVPYYKAVINISFEKCGYNRIVCVSLLVDARIGFNILLLLCDHVCACQH